MLHLSSIALNLAWRMCVAGHRCHGPQRTDGLRHKFWLKASLLSRCANDSAVIDLTVYNRYHDFSERGHWWK